MNPNPYTEQQLALSEREVNDIQRLARAILSQYQSSDDPELIRTMGVYAHELPKRLRVFLNDFTSLEPPSGTCRISGFPIRDETIGTTPAHWKHRASGSPAVEEEVFLLLCGALLGDAIAWATQQNGSLVHDVIPIRGHEHEQVGSSSEELLWWHCEDAFHPYRGDYLGMLCLRNPDNVPTLVASIDAVRLEERVAQVLFEPRFTIRPDESHLEKNAADVAKVRGGADSALASAYARIEQMRTAPEKIAVLYGDRKAPYLRVDPYYMGPLDDDPEAQEALKALVDAINGSLLDLVLKPGECCFIDNYRTVHGRKPFKARYDGHDRWLKRINIARDLRKSRSARQSCASRVLF